MTNSELNIITKVCEVLGVERELLFHLNRKREIVEARMVAVKLIHLQYDAEMPKKEEALGKIFNKDRCSIIHYLKMHEILMESYPKYRINYLAALNATQAMELPIVQFDLIEEYNNVPQL